MVIEEDTTTTDEESLPDTKLIIRTLEPSKSGPV